MDNRNLTMLTDLYELTMMQGFFYKKKQHDKAVFDLFYRRNPSNNGFAIVCGLEQIIDYVKSIGFSQSDVDYLSTLNLFTPDFLEYLKGFKFDGEIYAVPEGTVVFPQEPLIRVEASIIEAQFLETTLLNILNHQSLIATKAARVKIAAEDDMLMEFGLRRAQGPDAGIYGSRAAYIGGCDSTSNLLAGKEFGIPVSGTHAHSWIMSFESELEAFRTYAECYPKSLFFLVDTYDTLKSGVPNAIKIFKEILKNGGNLEEYGVRIDSGDLSYLSKKIRKMLNAEGLTDAKICASGDLDENLIKDLKLQGAKINLWGVGTNLITSADCPALGGVYKLVSKESDGKTLPKIKISENLEKVTNPGKKKIIRFYDKETNKIRADIIMLDDETINLDDGLEIFDPLATWKRMVLSSEEVYAKELLVPIFKNGICVYKVPSVSDIREHCVNEINTLWDEEKRLVNPHVIPVDLSLNLWNLKQKLIDKNKNRL